MTEKGKPLTREDVLKMIEEHGGPEGLDLSGRNLEGIDLCQLDEESPPLDLHGIILKGANLEHAALVGANLQGANLFVANLQEAKLAFANLQHADLCDAKLQEASLFQADLRDAFLWDANLRRAILRTCQLQGAKLSYADLQEAILEYAELQGAELKETDLRGTNLEYATLQLAYMEDFIIDSKTKLQNVDWGPDYMVGEEKEKWFKAAERVYRTLKQWYTQAGMYDIAGQFHFREMTVRRKAAEWWPYPVRWRNRRWWGAFLSRPQLEAYRLLCGYGEKPWQVVASAAVVVFGLAGIYTASALSFLDSLYYSAVSFTALGYGLWVSNPEGWVKGLGVAEAFIGVFMMALFLITFVRKMTR